MKFFSKIAKKFIPRGPTDTSQVMTWFQPGDKPLPESMLTYCQWDPWEQFLVNFNQNTNNFFQENAFENAVCKIASGLMYQLI